MYAKGNHNVSFSATVEYNLSPDKFEEILYHSDDLRVPLDSNDALGKQALISDFEEQARYRNLANPCGHTIIGIGEKGGNWELMTNHEKQAFCSDFIKEKGFENTQYVFISHKDTDHDHLHLIYNRVDNNGKGIHQDKNKIDNELIGYKLSEKYNLPHPEASRKWIMNELSKDSKYIDTVLNRDISGTSKVKPLASEQLAELKASNPILSSARNQHHLSKLAQSQGVSFREIEGSIYLNQNKVSKEDLSAVYKFNRQEVEAKKQEQRMLNINGSSSSAEHQLKIHKTKQREEQKTQVTEIEKRRVQKEDILKQYDKENSNKKGKGLSL